MVLLRTHSRFVPGRIAVRVGDAMHQGTKAPNIFVSSLLGGAWTAKLPSFELLSYVLVNGWLCRSR